MATGGDRRPATVYLDDEDRTKMEEIAAENDRNLSAEIRRAVRLYLERYTRAGVQGP